LNKNKNTDSDSDTASDPYTLNTVHTNVCQIKDLNEKKLRFTLLQNFVVLFTRHVSTQWKGKFG
jgi:hypothetical protein